LRWVGPASNSFSIRSIRPYGRPKRSCLPALPSYSPRAPSLTVRRCFAVDGGRWTADGLRSKFTPTSMVNQKGVGFMEGIRFAPVFPEGCGATRSLKSQFHQTGHFKKVKNGFRKSRMSRTSSFANVQRGQSSSPLGGRQRPVPEGVGRASCPATIANPSAHNHA
jgi:hypothetical protein